MKQIHTEDEGVGHSVERSEIKHSGQFCKTSKKLLAIASAALLLAAVVVLAYNHASPSATTELSDWPWSTPKIVMGGKGKPVPSNIYGAEKCPFAEWYGTNLPQDFQKWENSLIKNFDDAWKKADSPTGVRVNDHDYNTKLGQGNTVGFLGARLAIHEGIPANMRQGLFGKAQTLDAVVRLSDFGASNSRTRFGRMAVKVPLASSWSGEANLLFTESLDTFPIGNWHDLAAFAGDGKGWMSGLNSAISAATSIGQSIGSVVLDGWTKEFLAKTYYSQLPYALGDQQAMKFALVSKVKSCDDTSDPCCLKSVTPLIMDFNTSPTDWATKKAGVVAEFLKKCDAVFDLQIQVRASKNGEVPESQVRWSESMVTVGTLTIPKQSCTTDWAVNERLRDGLSEKLGVEAGGVDKMFAFHPMMTDEANKPLGPVNTFRSNYYPQFAEERLNTLQKGVFKTLFSGESVDKIEKFDFSALGAQIYDY